MKTEVLSEAKPLVVQWWEVVKMTRKKQEEKTNNILIGLAIVLIVFSTVQAFQIDEIKDELEVSKISGSGSYSGNSRSNVGTRTAAPKAAPTMVGGC